MAVGFSVPLHALIAWLAVGTLKGGMIPGDAAGAEGDSGAVEVTLEGLKGSAQTEAVDPASEALASMFRKVEAEQAELPADSTPMRPTADLQKIFEAIDRVRAARNTTAGDDSQGAADKGGNAAASRSGGKPRASAGDLWGQIKPCWDQLPSVSTVPVTLVITLDDEGRIAKPPQIVRPTGAALDERRLISEARALAAVTACNPYLTGSVAGMIGSFEVRFGR